VKGDVTPQETWGSRRIEQNAVAGLLKEKKEAVECDKDIIHLNLAGWLWYSAQTYRALVKVWGGRNEWSARQTIRQEKERILRNAEWGGRRKKNRITDRIREKRPVRGPERSSYRARDVKRKQKPSTERDVIRKTTGGEVLTLFRSYSFVRKRTVPAGKKVQRGTKGARKADPFCLREQRENHWPDRVQGYKKAGVSSIVGRFEYGRKWHPNRRGLVRQLHRTRPKKKKKTPSAETTLAG